jgi:hypothetical protein
MWLRIRLFTFTSLCNPREVSHCIYSAPNSYVCCELLHHVGLVCCSLSQTAINCQQLLYQVHVTAFLSTCIQVDSLLNCSSIYCVKLYVLKIWGIGSLQFLCMFLHVCDISSLCCTSCASCFCTGVCVCVRACRPTGPAVKERCPRSTGLDFHGLLWIPLQLLSPSTCTVLVAVTCCWALWGGWLQADELQGNVAVGLKQCCVPVPSVSAKI